MLDDGEQPISSADLKLAAVRIHEARLRYESHESRTQALRVRALVVATLVAFVGLCVAEAGVWGVATPSTLALVGLQVLVLGFLGWIGSQGWRQLDDDANEPGVAGKVFKPFFELVAAIALLAYVKHEEHPLSWWIIPEAIAVVIATGLFLLGVPFESPPTAVLLLTGIPLVFCAAVLSPLLALPVLWLRSAGARAIRLAPDPVDRLVELLFRWTADGGIFAYGCKQQWDDPQPSGRRGRHRWGQEPHDIWEMEDVARSLEMDFASSHVPWGSGAAAWAAAEDHGERMAAWLRRREDELLMSVPGVRRRLAFGLLAACDRRWSEIEVEPPVTRPRRFVVRMLPRLILATAIGVAAVFVPDQLPIDGAAQDVLTVSLAVVAVNALITPNSAVGKAFEKVGTAFGGK